MDRTLRARRLIAATAACAALVLGLSVLLGNGRAQASATHTCSAPDKQFIQTVRSNMDQLQYWSDELQTNDVDPSVVVQQARSEAAQVDATGPTDPTLSLTRKLIRTMFVEYGRAVYAKYNNGDAGVHMQLAYTLANSVHDQLVGAQGALEAKGCDVAELLTAAST
jgi:hypothetical protein